MKQFCVRLLDDTELDIEADSMTVSDSGILRFYVKCDVREGGECLDDVFNQQHWERVYEIREDTKEDKK